MMRWPAKLGLCRHMVEPQSPLPNVRNCSEHRRGPIPKERGYFFSTVRCLFVLLWGSLGDLELVLAVHGVAGIG